MRLNVRVDGHRFDVVVEDINATPVIAVVDGQRIEVWPESASQAASQPEIVLPEAESSSRDPAVYSPIPGVIISVSVSVGDVVRYGQELCVLEAMKMKQAIRSPQEGTIAQVHVVAGQQVGHHAPLVTYTD